LLDKPFNLRDEEAMSKLMMGVLAAAFTLATAGVNAATSQAEYQAELDRIKADYKAASERCKPLTGNAKDVCIAEAKAAERKAKANAEAKNKGTDKARQNAQIEAAEADYDVAKEKCDAKKGNDKDVCMKEAKAKLTSAKADVKANREVREARKDATEDKRDAQYKVAIEKCDAMKGDAKDACKAQAKAKFGKS
jgi:hypothetical protein